MLIVDIQPIIQRLYEVPNCTDLFQLVPLRDFVQLLLETDVYLNFEEMVTDRILSNDDTPDDEECDIDFDAVLIAAVELANILDAFISDLVDIFDKDFYTAYTFNCWIGPYTMVLRKRNENQYLFGGGSGIAVY